MIFYGGIRLHNKSQRTSFVLLLHKWGITQRQAFGTSITCFALHIESHWNIYLVASQCNFLVFSFLFENFNMVMSTLSALLLVQLHSTPDKLGIMFHFPFSEPVTIQVTAS